MLDETRSEHRQRNQSTCDAQRKREVAKAGAVVEYVTAGEQNQVPLAPVETRAGERLRSSGAYHQQRHDAPAERVGNRPRAAGRDAAIDVECHGRECMPLHA